MRLHTLSGQRKSCVARTPRAARLVAQTPANAQQTRTRRAGYATFALPCTPCSLWYNRSMTEHDAAHSDDQPYRTDCEPIDWAEYERWARLSPGQRIMAMMNARSLAIGLIRGRLRRRYPHLSEAEITWKMLAELERGY